MDIQPQDLWIQNALQAGEALKAALQTFYLAADKELAVAAGYKALGMDPRDAPRFGWGLLAARPSISMTQQQAPTAPQDRGRLSAGLLGGLLILALALGGAAGYLLAPKGAPSAAGGPPGPAPAAKVEDVELEVQWKVGPDGKWQTTVEPRK
jgi:hypothetical protein